MRPHFPHLRSYGVLRRDCTDNEQTELNAARSEAVQSARDMITEALKSGESLADVAGRLYEVVDESGRIVATVQFIAAFGVTVKM